MSFLLFSKHAFQPKEPMKVFKALLKLGKLSIYQNFGFFAFFVVSFSCIGRAQDFYTKDFVNSTFASETLWEPAITAAFSNWVTQPAGFGAGESAYGYHYGVAVADNVNGKFMRKMLFASASKHEDIFKPITTGGKWTRIGLALEHSLLVSSDKGSKVFNWSSLPASFASASLSNAYQPAEQRSISATLSRFGTNCAGYAAGDVWTEFLEIMTHHPLWNKLLKNR